jgi:hypothetical protein
VATAIYFHDHARSCINKASREGLATPTALTKKLAVVERSISAVLSLLCAHSCGKMSGSFHRV